MRTVDTSWSGVAVGFGKAAELERQLQVRWTADAQRARELRLKRRVSAWEGERRAVAEHHDRAIRAWQLREQQRRRAHDERVAAWEEQRRAARERAGVRAGLPRSPPALAIVVAVGLAALLVSARPAVAAGLALATLLACSAPALSSLVGMTFLRVRRPTPEHVNDERPSLAPSPPRPTLEPAPSLRLVERWWDVVAFTGEHRGGPALAKREHGDKGEQLFTDQLGGLGPGYVAVRDMLVKPNLDADMVLVGPTGVWVFEVKHWAGEIVCQGGRWQRTRTYHQPGGRQVTETKTFRPPDEQWVRERDAIEQTIRKKLATVADELCSQIRGGVVFSHPDAHVSVDDTACSWWGTPSQWARAVAAASPQATMTPQLVLDVVEVLLTWHHRLQRDSGAVPRCAFALALAIERQLADDVSAFCG